MTRLSLAYYNADNSLVAASGGEGVHNDFQRSVALNPAYSYAARPGTLEGALDLIRSGDTIATGIHGDEPTGFFVPVD